MEPEPFKPHICLGSGISLLFLVEGRKLAKGTTRKYSGRTGASMNHKNFKCFYYNYLTSFVFLFSDKNIDFFPSSLPTQLLLLICYRQEWFKTHNLLRSQGRISIFKSIYWLEQTGQGSPDLIFSIRVDFDHPFSATALSGWILAADNIWFINLPCNLLSSSLHCMMDGDHANAHIDFTHVTSFSCFMSFYLKPDQN